MTPRICISNGLPTRNPDTAPIALTGILLRGDQTAIIWEGDEPDQHKHITYRELHGLSVCECAESRRREEEGDRITIYMPMIPEATDGDARMCAD